MGFSRQEYWSGLPFPSPGDLPDPGIEPRSPRCRQTLYSLSYQGNPSLRYYDLINVTNYINYPVQMCNQVSKKLMTAKLLILPTILIILSSL